MAIDTPSTETAEAPAAVAPAAQKPQSAFRVSLERFATKLSGTDKRVALIHGFVHTEKVAKRFRDTHANYAARYQAFAGTPIRNLSAAATTK